MHPLEFLTLPQSLVSKSYFCDLALSHGLVIGFSSTDRLLVNDRHNPSPDLSLLKVKSEAGAAAAPQAPNLYTGGDCVSADFGLLGCSLTD